MFRKRIAQDGVERFRRRTIKDSVSAIVTVNKKGSVSITGMVTTSRRYSLMIYPAVTSASTPADTVSVLCDRRKGVGRVVLRGGGPSLILMSDGVVTGTPIHFLITNVNSTLSACFRKLSGIRARRRGCI